MINKEMVLKQAEQRINSQKDTFEVNAKQVDNLKEGKKFDWTIVEEPERLAERARRMGLYEDAGALIQDPANIEIGKRVYEKIIGANDLLEIKFLFKGARMARAVGRVVLPVSGGKRLGTGFMVTPRIMMTNNHVLRNKHEAGQATLEFDFFTREDGTTGPVSQFRLLPELFFITDGPLDFSLVAIERENADAHPIRDRGWFALFGPSGKAVVGERVSIIQHPDGKPQKVTVHNNQVSGTKNDYLHYKTDTKGGSSGSPVLNIDWELVALHHAAVGLNNEGIRISSIIRKIQEIITQESTYSSYNIDPSLAKELLSAKPYDPDSMPCPDYPPPVDERGEPYLNEDGTVSWKVPVTITLGVGDLPAPPPAPTPEEPPAVVSGSDHPALQAALQAMENTSNLVYYSQAQDDQARDHYYPDLEILDGDELYRTLSQLLADTHTTTLNYKTARLNYLYPWIDRRDGSTKELRGIYSNDVFDALEIIHLEAEMEFLREQAIREHLLLESIESIDEDFLRKLEEHHPFNCEHVVPQSWFHKKKQPKSDLHHLFTCEWACNSFRGNRAYAEIEQEAFRDDCGESEISEFEPKHGKGAVARATLYFLLRYPREIADSSKEMPKGRLQTLIKWAQEDAVDRWEKHRNAEIQKVQGNRNPLIDFPELVDKINFELGWA